MQQAKVDPGRLSGILMYAERLLYLAVISSAFHWLLALALFIPIMLVPVEDRSWRNERVFVETLFMASGFLSAFIVWGWLGVLVLGVVCVGIDAAHKRGL